MTSRLPFAALAALLLLVGCAGPRPTATEPGPSSALEVVPPDPPARPLPRALVTPPDFQAAIDAGTRTTTGHPGPSYWANTARYDLSARLLAEEKRLEGTARIRYTNNSPDTLDMLAVELVQNLHQAGVQRNIDGVEITGGMNIQNLAVNGQRYQRGPRDECPAYRISGTRLYICPSEPVLPGTSTRLVIDYAFAIPQQGAGARMGYSGKKAYGETNLFHIAYWYPIMAVYDDVVGWMDDRYLGNAEFYSDHGQYTFSIKAPAEWTVQATGTLENPRKVLRPRIRQRRRRAYRSDTPVRILSAGERATPESADSLTWQFSAGDVRDVAFSAVKDANWDAARTSVGDRDGQADSTHIDAFWREQAPLWSEMVRYEQDVITHHSNFTGVPYPWPHMTAVEGGGIIEGGMEFPMMTLIGDYNGQRPEALYAVTAHELSHMWIPMIVSNNERRRAWMDEGTTTFNEGQARAEFYPNNGVNPARQDQQRYLNTARAEAEGPIMRWSDYHYTPRAYGTASYPKPASMLVALRGLLGEETFKQAYQGFMNDWSYRHPYPQDFFNAFETTSGRDLDWFWDAFYYQTWTLDQALQSAQNTEAGVQVTVADRDRAMMPVDLTLTLENGRTLERRLPVDPWLKGRRLTTATFETPAPVTRIEIDAAHAFPDINRSNNVWERPAASSQ